MLCFEKLSFAEVAHLHGAFKRYHEAGKARLKAAGADDTDDVTANNNSDLDMSSFSAEVASVNLKPPTEVNGENETQLAPTTVETDLG